MNILVIFELLFLINAHLCMAAVVNVGNSSELIPEKVRRVHRRRIGDVALREPTVNIKRSQKRKRVKLNKPSRGKGTKIRKTKKPMKNRSRPRKRFDDRNQKYQNLWKKISKTDKCSCGPIAGGSRDQQRIVNGEEAVPHEFPWIVSLMDGGGYWYCGGTVLNEEWVVTAAHCVHGLTDKEADDVWVRVGDHDNSDPGDTEHDGMQTLKVKKIIVHRMYDPNTINNDIALLKLKKKIDFKKFRGTVAPICLPEVLKGVKPGEKVTVAGWGLFEDGGTQAKKLNKVDLELLSMQSCRNDFKYKNNWITSRMMCTWVKDKDACQGDSGGPLIWQNSKRDRYELVGVVSWGIGCASRDHPGVFTKLSYFLPWVLNKTKKSRYCSG